MATHNLPAGIFAAMAVGSQLTQTTLNTFHLGNDADLVTNGVPRITEILNNSTSSHNCVYQLGPNESRILIDRFGSACGAQETLLDHVCGRLVNCNRPYWLDAWEIRFGPIPKKQIYSIEIDLVVAINFNVSIQQIIAAMMSSTGLVFVACSPFQKNSCVLTALFCSNDEIRAANRILSCGISEYQAEEYHVHRVFAYELLAIAVKGMAGIVRCIQLRNGNLNVVTNLEPHVLILQLGTIIPELICSKAESMKNCFGIEVAAKCIFLELQQIMPHLLPCHVQVIVHVMTCTGKIRPVNRYTVRDFGNPLQRISFEEAVKNLVVACADDEVDWLNSVSSSVCASKTLKK